MPIEIDHFDRRILAALQVDGDLTQRALSEVVGLSANACWHRLKRLREAGVILGTRVRIDREKVGLSLVVVVMLRTGHHSAEWLAGFHRHVSRIPEVVDLLRIGGDYDYMLKVVTSGMASYDDVYRRLITGMEFVSVNSYFVMEAMAEDRPLTLGPDHG